MNITVLSTKINEVEKKIPDTSSLLTAVLNIKTSEAACKILDNSK